MEDPVNAGSTGQFVSVDLVSRTFDALLEVNCKLLDHPVWGRGAWSEEALEGGRGWSSSALETGDLLQQGLGLACWVVRSEVLVLIHLLLNGQQLALQFVPKPRQCVTDVVGQLLGVVGG